MASTSTFAPSTQSKTTKKTIANSGKQNGLKFMVTFQNDVPVVCVCRPKSVIIKSKFFKEPFRSTYYEKIVPKN